MPLVPASAEQGASWLTGNLQARHLPPSALFQQGAELGECTLRGPSVNRQFLGSLGVHLFQQDTTFLDEGKIMHGYLITYDLKKPARDYSTLFVGIQSFGTYAHVLESVWIIKSDLSALQVRDYLKRYLDGDDKIFVTGIIPREWASVNLAPNTITWMQQQLAA
jgi:hypothetical protein